MKNNYPKSFITKALRKMNNKQQINKSQTEPEPAIKTITLPYIKNRSEMTARLLRPFNIDVAHKPTHKLRSYFTKYNDKTTTTATSNDIYMIPCKD